MKSGLDYFPLDVHLDDKFKLIQAEYGLEGFAVIVKLYQRIYGELGYYCEWTDDVALLFACEECKLGGGVVSEILQSAIRRGLFDKGMFDKYHILTSRGIQARYLSAAERRKNVEIDARYLLVEKSDLLKNVNILGKNVNISEESADISEQSKVKESKGNKSKVNTICDAPGDFFIALPLNDGSEYKVFQKEVDENKALYPAVNVEQEYRNMVGWLNGNQSRRKTRSGIKRFINGWLAREQNNPKKTANKNDGTYSSFDVDEFFNDALKRSYEEG